MPIVLFEFARKLKITRFTIDVLTQRLEEVESLRDGASEECERFVGLSHGSVSACDQLHDALRARFSSVQPLDSGAIAFLEAGFVELHRKIAESIACLNSFEHGLWR
jgi:aryl-alcohol dehydrogenase-like predicted oxidoreductase